jgi:hypothetical protein
MTIQSLRQEKLRRGGEPTLTPQHRQPRPALRRQERANAHHPSAHGKRVQPGGQVR